MYRHSRRNKSVSERPTDMREKGRVVSMKAKSIKIIIVALVLAALVMGYYYYLSNKSKTAKEEIVQITTVQNVLMRDLEDYYPPSPKEVLKYYSDITQCFYNEEYTDEELEQLALKIQELYDDELVANKSQEDYMKDLRDEIADMKIKKCTISSYQVSASTDVEFYSEGDDSYAKLYCTYNMYQAGTPISSKEQFVLRKDENEHWKILGWELVNG